MTPSRNSTAIPLNVLRYSKLDILETYLCSACHSPRCRSTFTQKKPHGCRVFLPPLHVIPFALTCHRPSPCSINGLSTSHSGDGEPRARLPCMDSQTSTTYI